LDAVEPVAPGVEVSVERSPVVVEPSPAVVVVSPAMGWLEVGLIPSWPSPRRNKKTTKKTRTSPIIRARSRDWTGDKG
jgi:hypothetical protein